MIPMRVKSEGEDSGELVVRDRRRNKQLELVLSDVPSQHILWAFDNGKRAQQIARDEDIKKIMAVDLKLTKAPRRQVTVG